ncbi:hypothetical protein [Streptomyces anthocyanicus]|uniref:hypothetical protein n=1 Tax=Streptomyces anthocyanicus TaxID=68174 RepID=UPI0033D276A7
MKPTAQRRRDRRDLLDNLLSRALRGRLSPAEAALLAESVREEQRVADQTRQSLAETGTAYGKHRAAADDAIREMEQRALDAEEQLTAYRSVLGPRPLDRIRDAEQRAAQAEEMLTAAHQCSNDAEAERARQHERAEQAIRRAAEEYDRRQVAEGRLTRIRDMADNWESRLPATIRTATAAEAVRNAAAGDYRPVMFGMAPAPADDDQAVTVAPGVAVVTVQPTAGTKEFAEQERARFERLYTRETVRADKAEARAQEAEEQAATQLNRARMWRQKAIETDDRADRFEAAWQSARHRASVHAQHAERLKQSNQRWYSNATAERRRAVEAERSAHAWEDTARQYATNMDDARHKADRYRLAWLACRRDRKADRAAMAAELPLITDRATIRNALDEPEPNRGECCDCPHEMEA